MMAMRLLQNARMVRTLSRSTIVVVLLLSVLLSFGCSKPEPLTEQKAKEIVAGWIFKREPVYAEVPQRVWWNPKAPKDDYDEKAVRTPRRLESAGLVTVTEKTTTDSAEYIAKARSTNRPT